MESKASATDASTAKKPLTRGRAAIAACSFVLGVGVLVFRQSDASDDVPLPVYASLCLLVGLLVLAFGALAPERYLMARVRPGRRTSPRTARIVTVVCGAAFAILGLVGLLA